MATAKASVSYPHVTKTPGVSGGHPVSKAKSEVLTEVGVPSQRVVREAIPGASSNKALKLTRQRPHH